MTENESSFTDLKWDPNIPGTKVRMKSKPSRVGFTTGKAEMRGAFLSVEIDFEPNEKEYKRYNLLELIPENKSHIENFHDGTFGEPSDIRNILTFEKVTGKLTNIYYSMESSNTDFFPHQFKPVLRFIESLIGGMLLADDVGLGKTIEAAYIWKEIQAPDDLDLDENLKDLFFRFSISYGLSIPFDAGYDVQLPSEVPDSCKSMILRKSKFGGYSDLKDTLY